MAIGIYKIENKINGKIYIGSSVNLSKRKERHFRNLKNNIHENFHLQNAYNKYGKNGFEFIIVKRTSRDNMLVEEQKLLDKYAGTSNCYNILLIAGSPFMKGRIKSEEHRRKLSAATTAYFRTHPEARERLRQEHLGTKASLETKEKMCKSKKRGSKHHNSKLTEQEVLNIRKLYEHENISSRALAKKYKVQNKATILNIIHRRTWTHI